MLKTLLTLAVFAVATPALAAQQVELRSPVEAPNGVVTLGDLFDSAGPAARTVVAAGGPAGGNLIIAATQVQALARAHGLVWSNAEGVDRVIARVVATPASERRVAREQVLAYARDLAAGEVVQPEDLIWTSTPAYGAPSDSPSDSATVIGLAAKRPLRARSPVSQNDVSAPQVIKRDDMISVAYQVGGIKLVLQGRAMSGAAVGDVVDILNPGSKKIIQAVATGPDEAVVGPEAERFKAAALGNPRLYASLR